jgi:hypothetical protein
VDLRHDRRFLHFGARGNTIALGKSAGRWAYDVWEIIPASGAQAMSAVVFPSSTSRDLPEFRTAVLEACRHLNLAVATMEDFAATCAGATRGSLAQLDRCDVYVGIFARRYGFVEPGYDRSVTECEYDHALARGLDCLCFFLADDVPWPEDRIEHAALPRLDALKKRIQEKHIIRWFRSPDDLKYEVFRSLLGWLNRTGRWNVERAPAVTADVAAICDFVLAQVRPPLPDFSGETANFVDHYLGSPDAPEPFGGRDDELLLLDRWVDGPAQPPYLLLTAPAGQGKSALLVRWVQRCRAHRAGCSVVYFPISIRFHTNRPSALFPDLTRQLAQAFNEPPRSDEGTARSQVVQYLRRPLAPGRGLIVVVDGLDELADWSAAANLFPPRPGPGLRVLVSARSRPDDPCGASWARLLGWGHPLSRSLELGPLRADHLPDVLRSMGCPIDQLGEKVNVVHELHRLSRGNPLVVSLYVKELWGQKDRAGQLRVEDLARLEPGLADYFERWWEEQRTLWGLQAPLREPVVQTLLNLLACALGPLSRDDILRLTPEVHWSTWSFDEALRPLRRFVVGNALGRLHAQPPQAVRALPRPAVTRREAGPRRPLPPMGPANPGWPPPGRPAGGVRAALPRRPPGAGPGRGQAARSRRGRDAANERDHQPGLRGVVTRLARPGRLRRVPGRRCSGVEGGAGGRPPRGRGRRPATVARGGAALRPVPRQRPGLQQQRIARARGRGGDPGRAEPDSGSRLQPDDAPHSPRRPARGLAALACRAQRGGDGAGPGGGGRTRR